jgi:hypothetical protein
MGSTNDYQAGGWWGFFCVSGDEVLAKVVGAHVCLGPGEFEMVSPLVLMFLLIGLRRHVPRSQT